MRIAILNDSHFGSRNDSPFILHIQEEFFSKVFFPYLIENNITQVLHLGDLFDRRKFINFHSLYFFKKTFLNPLINMGVKLDIILGNHDTYLKNTNEINSPELLLSKYNNIQVFKCPSEQHYGDDKFLFLPWICADNYEDSIRIRDESNAKICFGHFDFVGFDMMKGVKSEGGFNSNDFLKFDKVISGHYHTRSNNKHIYYCGTQYEMCWSDYADKKGFHVFDTETHELEFIENSQAYFHKIFYNDEKNNYSNFDFTKYENCFIKIFTEKKTDIFSYEKFCEGIKNIKTFDLKIIDESVTVDNDILSEETFDSEDTLTIINNYTNSVEDRYKKDVKNLFSQLYVEVN